MLNLTQIISEGTECLRCLEYQNKLSSITWKNFKKSRSHSPKPNYTFKLAKIPDSSLEKLQKTQILKKSNKIAISPISKNILLADKTEAITLNHQDNTTSIIIKDNALNTTLEETKAFFSKSSFSQEELVEEHPLYANRFPKIVKINVNSHNMNDSVNRSLMSYKSKSPMTPKEITKESQIKLFQLNSYLEKADIRPTHRNAVICQKILEVLEVTPELFPDISKNLIKSLKNFLFCEEDAVFDRILSFNSEKKMKKPQCFYRIIQVLFEIIDETYSNKIRTSEQINEEFSNFSKKNKELEEELCKLQGIIKDLNENMQRMKDEGEKHLKDQVFQ